MDGKRVVALALALAALVTGATAMAENRLAQESSPYLRQHATNPVDWYPWGAEALDKAKREGKLIFLSIGYAACHWCHVMERESFTDPRVAELLNAHFVSIKVDREERPDLDAYYMKAVVAMTGQGGWPMTLFLTPSLAPLFGGTYFPPESRHGMPAFSQLLQTVSERWSSQSAGMTVQAEEMNRYLKAEVGKITKAVGMSAQDLRESAVAFWRTRFDHHNGGFGEAPKFPQPSLLSLFLRRTALGAGDRYATMAYLALDQMAAGGVRDQLGGAFHRYSTDPAWKIPHFEIMLYDNALLARVYLEAFQMTGRDRYAWTVRQILDDVIGRMRLEDGGYASSLDADSEGEEGRFYTWTSEEFDQVLGKEDGAKLAALLLDRADEKVDDRSVLRFRGKVEELDKQLAPVVEQRAKLLQHRTKRIPPSRDDKVLTSWNALMVSALAKAAVVLNEPRYLEAARAAERSLLTHALKPDGLIHSRLGVQYGAKVFLEDYAFLIQALLDLYQADPNQERLRRAHDLAQTMIKRFQPALGQPMRNTPQDQPEDVPALVELEDHVVPSGNAAATIALRRLAMMTGNEAITTASEALLHTLNELLENRSQAAPELLWAWDLASEKAKEVVIVGPMDDPLTKKYQEIYHRRFLPQTTLAVVEAKADGAVEAGAKTRAEVNPWPMLANRSMLDGKPTAYVCTQGVCMKPVTNAVDYIQMLDAP